MEIDHTEQIFDFITVPSFVSLFSESMIELWVSDMIEHSFAQITGKDVAEEDISDPYGQFVSIGMRYFQGLYLKAVRSRKPRVKKFSTIPTRTVIYDTYVDFNDDSELDINTYKMLIR